MKNEIYLITGAAGFLGSHICKELLKRGEKVRALVLKGDPAIKYVPEAVEVIEGNLCDRDSLKPFFEIPKGEKSILIHCASMVTVNPEYSKKLVDINVGGTKNIIEMCLSHTECKKLVYVSSTGAIPELPKGQKIKETNCFDEKDERIVGWYSKTKAMATAAVLDAVKKRKLNACIVHPSGILGPEDHAISPSTGAIIQILNGEMSMGMGGSFNLSDVRDLAHGCILAADKGGIGECYILGNKEVTLKELCQMMKKTVPECKPPKFFIPISVAYKIAAFMEKKAKKSGKTPVMTTFSIYNLARNNNFDYSKAERELGYTTRPYEDTMKDEVKWLKAEGKIKTA